MQVVSKLKKGMVLIACAVAVSLSGVTGLHAQSSSEQYLYQIMKNTEGMLEQLNNLPSYLKGLGEFIISWMKEDDSDSTAKMQAHFANLGDAIVQSYEAQNAAQLQLTADLFNISLSSLTNPPNSPEVLKKIPNINDLVYATMVGAPPVPKAQNASQAPYRYIRNAGGLLLTHVAPGLNWQGPEAEQDRYQNYYNTVMAIQSFNGYVLTNQMIEAQKNDAQTKLQNTLIAAASNSDWVADISTEKLGKVFRQLLMFQSQSYVLITQLVQLQKQLLQAQAMTNTLLITMGQATENLMVSNAQGVRPQPSTT